MVGYSSCPRLGFKVRFRHGSWRYRPHKPAYISSPPAPANRPILFQAFIARILSRE